MRAPSPRCAAAALAAMLAVAGCAGKPPRTRLAPDGIQVLVAADANSASATQLDLVLVFDANADAALPSGSADWFARKPALLAGLASEIQLVPLQLPAPYALPSVALPPGYDKAIGVYSYASYLSPAGQPRCNLTPYRRVTLRLLNDHIDCAGQ